MDEMNIKSIFMTGIIGKIIERAVRKNTGCKTDIAINTLTVKNTDKVRLHIDADIMMDREEVTKLMKHLGVG